MIRQTQAQYPDAEVDHALHVGREEEHMRQPAGVHHRHSAAGRRRPAPCRHCGARAGRALRTRRNLLRDYQLLRNAVRVEQPQAASVGQGVWRARDTHLLDALPPSWQVSLVDAPAHVLQPLATCCLMHRHPAMRISEGVDVEAVCHPPNVQAKGGVKSLGLVQVGHREDHAVDRVHGGHAGAALQVGSLIHACLRLVGHQAARPLTCRSSAVPSKGQASPTGPSIRRDARVRHHLAPARQVSLDVGAELHWRFVRQDSQPQLGQLGLDVVCVQHCREIAVQTRGQLWR